MNFANRKLVLSALGIALLTAPASAQGVYYYVPQYAPAYAYTYAPYYAPVYTYVPPPAYTYTPRSDGYFFPRYT